MNSDFIILIILIGLVLLVDIIRVRLKIAFSDKNLWLILGKIIGIAIAYITFNFGIDVVKCVENVHSLCNIIGLNILLYAIGIICMIASFFGYCIIISKKIYQRRASRRRVI